MRIKDRTWEILCAAPSSEDFLSVSTDKDAEILYIIHKEKSHASEGQNDKSGRQAPV